MKAVYFKNNELHFSENYPIPDIAQGEALVKVLCAGVCATDIEIIKGYMGFEGIPGHEFVGTVEKCAKKDLLGKRVSGEINIACGNCSYCKAGAKRHCPTRSVLGIVNKDGAFAEYVALPMENLHLVPESLSDEEAVFIEPLAAAFEILEQISLSSHDNVCLMGDGRLGLLVAQVLATTGCKLTVEGRHDEKLAILNTRGIKTKKVSSPATCNVEGKDGKFDLVVDCTSSPSGLEEAMKKVKPKGKIVVKTTVAKERTLDLNQLVIDEITLIGSRCGPFEPAIKALTEKTVHVEPLVNKVFPLHKGIEAFSYAMQNKVIKVLIHM